MKNGPYTLVIAPSDYPGKKYRGRYCYEHRLVYWQKHGILPPVVHHKNDDRQDNRPRNLKGSTNSDHSSYHGYLRRKPIQPRNCKYCGKFFAPRRKGGANRFCSRACYRLACKTGNSFPGHIPEWRKGSAIGC